MAGDRLLAHVFRTLVDAGVEKLVVIVGYEMETIVSHFGDERVTEERWTELGGLKEPGQTWEDVLGELVEGYKTAQLIRDVNEIEERMEDNWVALEDLSGRCLDRLAYRIVLSAEANVFDISL